MIWGCWVRGSHPFLLTLLVHNLAPIGAGGVADSAKLCKLVGYMECKMNKWDCYEGEGVRCFQ